MPEENNQQAINQENLRNRRLTNYNWTDNVQPAVFNLEYLRQLYEYAENTLRIRPIQLDLDRLRRTQELDRLERIYREPVWNTEFLIGSEALYGWDIGKPVKEPDFQIDGCF